MSDESATEALRGRLAEVGWDGDLASVVTETRLAVGPGVSTARLAQVALERSRDGHPEDAVRLAIATLMGIDPPDEEDEELDQLLGELDTWARWRLHVLLRERASQEQREELPPELRVHVDAKAAAPLELEADLDALEQQINERLGADGVEFADGLWAVTYAVAGMEPAEDPARVLRATRAALYRSEKAFKNLSEEAEAAVGPLQKWLWRTFVKAFVALDDGDPEHVTARKWVTSITGGTPRTFAIEPEWLSEKGRDSLLELLEGKHERSQTSTAYGVELLRLGREVLGIDRRLALAREVKATGHLIDVLLEAGRKEEAVEVALDEANGTEGCPDPLARVAVLEEAGLLDEAIQLMDIVTRRSVDERHFEWLVDRLTERGRDDEALEVQKRLFDRRCGLSTYEQLRDHVSKKQWPALRKELLARLRERRLYRIILDIAFAEEDEELAKSCADELDEHQKQYVRQRVEARDDPFAKAMGALFGESYVATPEGYVPRESLPPPERVRHKKYGVGTVLSHTGDGEHRKLEIEFKHFGTKTILERFVEAVDSD